MPSATDNRTTELLPCPFCGGEAKLILGHYSEDSRLDTPWLVRCRKCGAESASVMPDWVNYNPYHRKTFECEAAMLNKAVKAWNTRHVETCHDASLECESQFICSLCECTVDVPLLWGEVNYCPNCGAKVLTP